MEEEEAENVREKGRAEGGQERMREHPVSRAKRAEARSPGDRGSNDSLPPLDLADLRLLTRRRDWRSIIVRTSGRTSPRVIPGGGRRYVPFKSD